MTWTKLSDDFSDDCWTLSDAALRLHVEGLNWSNRKLLDVRIPRDDVRKFKRPEALPELLDGGWWREDGDHLVIVHHGSYQRLKKDVIAQSEANAANASKRGSKPKPSREIWNTSNSNNESLSESLTEMDRTGQDGLGLNKGTLKTKAETNSETLTANPATGEITDSDWDVVEIPKPIEDGELF